MPRAAAGLPADPHPYEVLPWQNPTCRGKHAKPSQECPRRRPSQDCPRRRPSGSPSPACWPSPPAPAGRTSTLDPSWTDADLWTTYTLNLELHFFKFTASLGRKPRRRTFTRPKVFTMVTTVVVNFSPYSKTKRLPGPITARAPVVASRPPARPVARDRAGRWVGKKFFSLF